MAEVMATISRSLHENGLEACQPSPSVYDFTCCNGAIGKHIHIYALDSVAHLQFIFELHSRYVRARDRAIILSSAIRETQI